jgi:hypothetical protein
MPDPSPVEKANLANMLAKLKAGKILTASEERRLKEYQEAQAAANAPAPKQPPRKKTGKEIPIASQDLADFLGVTIQRLGQLQAEGHAVRIGRGKYDLFETGKRYIEFQRTRTKVKEINPDDLSDEGTPKSLEAAKLQKTIWDARRSRLAYEVELGLVIPKTEVEETGVAVGALFSAELDAAQGDLPGQLAGVSETEVRKRLRARFSTLIDRIRERIEAK